MMHARSLAVAGLVVLAGAGCGDNILPDGEPLAPASDLAIVAHQDDDLLFLQPELHQAVQRVTGVTNVYVTAGDRGRDYHVAETRYAGLMAAYGSIAGSQNWHCGWIEIASHAAEHCRLEGRGISLVFLGYPDGGVNGEHDHSLLNLWQGKVTSADTVARRPATYDRQGLVTVLAEIIAETAPRTLRTLEVAATHGNDHADHRIVGALAVLATAASPEAPELISYRGYNIEDEPVNVSPALFARTRDALAYYEACEAGCAPCGRPCETSRITQEHLDWLARHYAIGMRRSAVGQLVIGRACVAAPTSGGNATLVGCASAPSWELDPSGTLRSSEGRCLSVFLTGEIVATDCANLGASGRFFLDDEGHLWSGVVPPATPDAAQQHLYCVAEAGGRPRAELCGPGRAPTVELVRTMTATPRTTAGLGDATGRAVRMAPLLPDEPPRLCTANAGGGLLCAPSTADGALLPAVRIDSPTAPLAIEPESLVLGDVDGDGATDACGRGAEGLSCATAASGYRAERWTGVLASTGPASPSDRSLAIAPGGAICGLTEPGVACLRRGATAISDVRSTWPARDAALWIADLDGDDAIDWCAATAGGPACSLGAERSLTDEGVGWGYAAGGLVEASAAEGEIPDTATATFTDIDGDGRADLCMLESGAVACARSLGHGFAPRALYGALPAGMAATSLWAEPARPGQPPRLCAADAATIACTADAGQ